MKKKWMGTFNETPQSHGELFDVCQNRHRGNAESEAAFQSIKGRLTERQRSVLWNLRRYGDHGATVDDLSQTLHTTPNAISGRITELRIKGKIKKIGTRPTRSGCAAAVWKAV